MKQAASLILLKPLESPAASNLSGQFKVLMVKRFLFILFIFKIIEDVPRVCRNAHGTFKSLHVFPGGAVDPSDAAEIWKSLTPPFATDAPLFAHRVAALRETFEECGVSHSQLFPNPSPYFNDDITEWRRKIRVEPNLYAKMIENEGKALPVDSLVHWSHWVTPVVEKRRFDTQFFLAAVDPSLIKTSSFADGSIDNKEIVEMEWLTPHEALSAFENERIRLFPPQYLTLKELEHFSFSDICDLVARKKTRKLPTPCQPHPFESNDDGKVLLLPGDMYHPISLGSQTKNRLKFEGPNIKIIVTGVNNAMGAIKRGSNSLL
ncbi:Nucleoside diphosphate-linked moiety X motif 19, mitochondrial [Physocladia obscura]|uniref:Nucleoside diphosphate-linked moiety X motif 19, mitochondrial n=1 Tax=Physocladia obscura TaxID=109957 RepID=A0AAD5XBU6_9FUNG|nr:Nucleoside diphosphate-linked moiety X motif 19, mitochondrial [Physocladia obscura]